MPEQFHPRDYVGLPYEAARALAVKAGWNPRRLTPDMVISAEFRAARLNFWSARTTSSWTRVSGEARSCRDPRGHADVRASVEAC